MNTPTTPTKPFPSERGQSVVVVAVSLAALLLLMTGAVFVSMAFFASTAAQNPDQGGAIFSMIEPEDISGVVDEALPHATATPSLGAIVGDQVYLVDPVCANTLNQGTAQ